MASLKEYFEARDKDKPAPKWVCGDRVSGVIGKIVVLGTVIREDYEDPKKVLCFLELPVKVEGKYRFVVHVPSRGMKRLKVM